MRYYIRDILVCFLALAIAFAVWRQSQQVGIELCTAIGGLIGASIAFRRNRAHVTSIVSFTALGAAFARASTWPIEFARDWPRIASMPGERQLAFWAPFFVLGLAEALNVGFALGIVFGATIAVVAALWRKLQG